MIENELKFVLKISAGFEKDILKMAKTVTNIEQSYLHCGKSLTVRLRKQTGKKTRFVLAVKRKISPGRCVEVEKKIAESDYLKLLEGAEGRLTKVRCRVGRWDVDFFKDKFRTYFVMAEIEMPEDVSEPDSLPDFITKNLLYKVPREDCRFSSRKLSNIEYAESLLAEL